MRVVIVGRDEAVIEPLVDLLVRENFEAVRVENVAGVQSCLKKGGLHFLLAEPSLLLNHHLGREVLKRCPLARLVALAAEPTLLGMVEALSSGLTDYFPRSSEYFAQVAETLATERRRLLRWQRLLLSESGLGLSGRPSRASREEEPGPMIDEGAESVYPGSEHEG